MRNASLFDAPPITVGELCRRIRRAIETSFPQRVRVTGEISDCSVKSSGHAYFSLKDREAVIKCVCFRGTLVNLAGALPLPDGTAVEALGRVTSYLPSSQYQLTIDDVVPVGRGELHRRFELLKERLRREGLFDADRKRPVPAFVRRVAIVTSRDGAALHDFLTTCSRRGAHIEVTLVHAPVQGEAAAFRLASAVRFAGTLPVDAVVVARGGGSIEDLWAFNTEVVAKAIAACRRPVISAVGHETDTTIADFVADERAATPTAAAEMVSPDRDRLVRTLAERERRMIAALRRAVMALRERFERLSGDVVTVAGEIVYEREQRLDDLEARLRAADPRRRAVELRRRIASAALRLRSASARLLADVLEHVGEMEERGRSAFARLLRVRAGALDVAEARLESLGPSDTLRRGYAIVFAGDGAALVDSARTRVGDPLDIELHRGRVKAAVTAKEDRHGEDGGKEEG